MSAAPDRSAGSVVPAEAKQRRTPPCWAVGLVGAVLLIAAVLVGLGRPTEVVLGVLAGAGYVGTEIVRRLNNE